MYCEIKKMGLVLQFQSINLFFFGTEALHALLSFGSILAVILTMYLIAEPSPDLKDMLLVLICLNCGFTWK